MSTRIHTKPKKVCDLESMELALSIHHLFPVLSMRLKELESQGWTLYVTDTHRGYCHPKHKWITIPLWAVRDKRAGKWVQYVAHEFAHTDTIGLERDPHGIVFMNRMKELCPIEYWHHELTYKPAQAYGAGITQEHAHKAVSIKCMDIFDLL